MPDHLSYVRAAIAAETACTAAKLEAERLRSLGLNATAAALATVARVEAVRAARAREDAEAYAQRASAWWAQRSPQDRQQNPVSR